MAHGKLQCFGSPLFLKNKFGVGYTLTIVKNQHPAGPQQDNASAAAASDSAGAHAGAAAGFVEMSKRLDALVGSFIPEAEPLSDVGAEQSFRLPFAASGRFVELFSAFDKEKDALGIAEYGISVTTLEEVFIRVGELEESLNDAPPADPRTLSDESDEPRLSFQATSTHKALTDLPAPAPAKSAHVAVVAPIAPIAPAEDDARHSEDTISPLPRGRSSESSQPPHGILHTDHHHHHRLLSASSEHLHKHVSFRDSDEDNRMQLAAAAASLLPPSQGKQKGMSQRSVFVCFVNKFSRFELVCLICSGN